MLDKINSLENVFYILGIIFGIKILIRLLLLLKNALYGFVLPRFFAPRNFVEKYGKWAIVTGCTQGIGRYYAEELASRGMSIVLMGTNDSTKLGYTWSPIIILAMIHIIILTPETIIQLIYSYEIGLKTDQLASQGIDVSINKYEGIITGESN